MRAQRKPLLGRPSSPGRGSSRSAHRHADPAEGFTYAAADTVINRGDVLVLAGRTSEVERVADLT
ncbi:hypothetical protein [Lentzea flaviverrucosa]|uniref:Trk system potassium uptake protein TrkA n=1 Tax=Lentzea flaviverrucosa TaxID=200379 RepID=A0A1H9XXH5_9PSEU|nr:hypothetical protein [Lentzea flaviverrucosa]RDI34372.1 hypothetical protein DFR72_101119 [Lentzea flaviverrucosa]SES50457.1 hypothetical protein SAMN05216195_12088 [Lentzea flaviverrucosa]